jgi:DnaK suppressor protein
MATQTSVQTPLDESQLTELRAALVIKRAQLLQSISGLGEPSPVAEPGDLADVATTEVAVGERTELAAQERALLAEIEHALLKLGNGTYGTSEASGEPIRYERLRALPWARTEIGEASE